MLTAADLAAVSVFKPGKHARKSIAQLARK
jgi:hypothetical protein